MPRLLTSLLLVTLTAVVHAEEPPMLKLEPAERERCLEVLRRGLKSPEFWPAMHAAEALTQAGQGEEVRRELEPKLATLTDDQQRCGVARELVRAGDRSHVAVMLRILAGENPHGHVHACESLYKVSELGDGAELQAAFVPDVHTPKTVMAAAALARWGNPAAFAWLRQTLKGDDPAQARLAAWVLGTLGTPDDLPGINAWRAKLGTPADRHFFDNSAALLGDATARTEVLKNLDHADPMVRTYAAVCAGEARLLTAKKQLLARLEDENLDAAIRAAQALLLLAQPPVSNPPGFSVNVYQATARNPRYSEGSVIALQDGSLLFATTEFGGDGEDHAAARIIAKRSIDGGHTWSEPRELQENVGTQNVMSVTLRHLAPPTELNRPLGMFYLVKNSPTDLKVQLRVSTDDGQTFGEPVVVTGTPGYHVFNNDRATRLSAGRWLVPVASTADVGKVNHFVCRCFLSDDNGKTWRAGTGQVDYEKRGAMEPEVLELQDGCVLMLFRTQSGHIGRSLSSDGGDTWGPPESFGVKAPEAPATLRRIPSTGDLMLIWNNNFQPGSGHGGKRTPLTVAISQDEGKSWKFQKDLETDPREDYSYPSLIFHRGRALLSYYVQEAGTSRISSRFRSIPIAWFYTTEEAQNSVNLPDVPPVDATTLRQKVMCGYQGWFRCPGDGTEEGWLHWSRNTRNISPRSIAVEMWPDMTEYSEAERYTVPGFRTADDQPGQLFSSANGKTVARHFDWMQQYGIDGVFVQRFLVNLNTPSFDTVLGHVRDSARNTGRVYAVCYDLTGTAPEQIVDKLTSDWKRLVDRDRVTADDRYLHHDGKPVLFVWGLFSDRFDAAIAHQLLDFLQQAGPYQATVIGGCPWYWRNEKNSEWARALRRLDVLSPWNVGNYGMQDSQQVASTASWAGDLQACRDAGQELLPVVYPGFGWTNLQGPRARDVTISRRGGAFFWEQFVAARKLGIEMVYVAMFDEVDEATAIFKISNNPPVEPRFQTLEGLPSDWYLRLTGEGTRLIRGEREADSVLPIRP